MKYLFCLGSLKIDFNLLDNILKKIYNTSATRGGGGMADALDSGSSER